MNIILRVTKIKDCPSFVDFRPGANLPDFKKYNLTYGWNGSGKTSFSRILRSFELGENYYTHTERVPEFELKLKNGNSIDQNDLTAFQSIRVFNKDFIEDSVFCTGGPKPIFFLGKENKEDKEKITKIEGELQGLKKDRDSKKALLEKLKTSRDKLLSEKARDIKNSLTTARADKFRNYERPNLERIIGNKSEELKTPDSYKLDKDRLVALQKAIQQTTKSAITPLSLPNFDISDILTEAKEFLQKSAISQIIEVLKSDEALGKWVEHGLTIHRERELMICAFCNQTIPRNRLSDLENHFNQDYQNLIESVRRLKEKCSTRRMAIYFPDASNFYEDMTSEYLNKKKEAADLIETFNERLDSVISVLEQKEQKPFSQLNLEEFAPIDEKPLQEINQIITRHNEKSENFDKQLDENKHVLEMHYIVEFYDTYNELLGEIKTLESDHSSLVKTITEKEQEIRRLKEKLISHHISAQQINKDLEQFLGRSDIQLAAADEKEGYQITRNGELAKNLSEGEKTALAIVYFLTKINEEGFDLKNGVIVIDDPVSSLDSSAIFQAFGFIKESIKGAGQIFILTHHFDFFRQVKKWFSYHKYKNEREYFMVICREENSIRKSVITQIDKLLIDYESEYHFLFSVLYRFTKKQEKRLEEMYSLPNIARKFLESFLAFRVPVLGNQNREPALSHRIDKISYEAKKKARIHRFIETHSHPRYESGVQDFDMTLLGETTDILNDLLEMVEHEDKKHYDLLVESVATPSS